MATKSSIQILPINRDAVVTYTQSGTYRKEQVIFHPHFGFGTVIRVRYGKVEVQFNSEKRNRIFICGMMTLDQRNQANGISAGETHRAKLSKRPEFLAEGTEMMQETHHMEADDIPFSMESFMNQLLDCSLEEVS